MDIKNYFIIIGVCLAYIGAIIFIVKLIVDFKQKFKKSIFEKKQTKIIKHPATITYNKNK